MAGGGLLSMGAVERLVARDARGNPGRPAARAVRAAAARARTSAASRCSRCPAGFSYVTFSHTGSTMSDGNPTPLALDGMGAFAGGRRHGHGHGHGRRPSRAAGPQQRGPQPGRAPGGLLGDRSKAYDPTAFGGTTTLVYDEQRRQLVEDFVSLNGTTVNCAGGISYRRRYWLTGEETVGGPEATPIRRAASRSATATCSRRPSTAGRTSSRSACRSRAAGRFSHEAAAVDQRTGIVYETEDPGSGVGAGFYRYTPRDPDNLAAGGVLRDARDHRPAAGRPARGPDARRSALPVQWVRIDDPDPTLTASPTRGSTFNQGWAKGGAKFNRLEGCWEDDSTIFFVSTSGGDAKNGDVNADGYTEGFGQVWAYRPAPRRRDADARLRVAVGRRAGLARTTSRSRRAAA